MAAILKILLLEDNLADVRKIRHVLNNVRSCRFDLCKTKKALLTHIRQFNPDIILANHSLPQINAVESLKIVRAESLSLPFIVVTNGGAEEFVAGIIKSGANDYVLKTNLARLPSAIDAALKQEIVRRENAAELADLMETGKNLMAIFNNSTEGFILIEANGTIKAFNSAIKGNVLLNINEQIVLGRNIFDYIGKAKRSCFESVIAKVLSGHTIDYDRSYDTLNGKTIWYHFTFNLVKDKHRISNICITGRDVTDLKASEHQKEFDGNNLDALINNTQDLMWSVSTDFKLITFNQAFSDMVKLTLGSTIQKGGNVMAAKFPTQQLQRYKKYYARAFAGEVFTEVEHNLLPEEFWSEISFYPMYEDGTIFGTACFSRNITEKIKKEEECLKSNERFELLVTATNNIIRDWDLTTNLLWWNKNYYAHLGYKKEKAGSDINSWYDGIHPMDKKRILHSLDVSLSNLEKSWTEEYRFLKADGSVVFVSDCVCILYNQKKIPHRMVGAMQDITQRKLAEKQVALDFMEKQVAAEKMSAVLNTLPANIALLDEKGVVVAVNQSWKTFADNNGFAGSNYSIGDNYIDTAKRASPEDSKDGKIVVRGIKNVLKKKLGEFVFEYTCNAPGVKRWFRMVVTPLQEKAFAGIVVMHIDISELRRLEEERLETKLKEHFNITRAILFAQEEERNQLGRELHDNINQLLAAIKMKLEFSVINYKMGVAVNRECIAHVKRAMIETRNLSHRMVIPRFTENSFMHALKDLVAVYSNKIRNVKLVISNRVENEISIIVKESFYRIVQEQLNNIEKYAKATTVIIGINLTRQTIQLSIKDNGVGFDTGKKTKGIGLTNIVNRAESFHGSVEIISAKGKGCVLLIIIPNTSNKKGLEYDLQKN